MGLSENTPVKLPIVVKIEMIFKDDIKKMILNT
jgi:hypothetical protein